MSGGLKGGTTTSGTSTQTKAVPPWLTDAQQGLLENTQDLTYPFLNLPAMRTAGFTPDHEAVFDLTRNLVQSTFSNPGAALAQHVGGGQDARVNVNFQPGQTAPQATAALFGDVTQAQQANPMSAALSQASQLDPNEIQQHMNPFIGSVVDSTLNTMRREKNRASADIGAKAAAAGSFGGSREAVQRSLLDRNFGDQVSQTTSQLMAHGFDRATANALANAQMRQQTGLANQQAQNTVGLANMNAGNTINALNAQLAQQAGMSNQNAKNQMSLANMSAANSMNALNTQLGNQMALQAAMQNAQFGQRDTDTANQMALANANTLNTFDQADFARRMAALQALYGQANAQRELSQLNLNVPWDTLKMLASIVGPTLNNTNSTTTGASNSQSQTTPGLLQLLSLGLLF